MSRLPSAAPRTRCSGKPLDLGDEVVAGSQERLAVANRRKTAGGGQLGLEAAGQHGRHVVPEDRLRLGGDELRRLQDGAGRGVAGLELLHLLSRVLDEHVLEQLVEVAPAGDRALGGPPLVEDRHDRAVVLGLADRVLVDERAEDGVRSLLALAHDRRAGEADLGGVGQRRHEVGVQGRRLRAVRLVDQDDDGLVGVEDSERLVRLVAARRVSLVPALSVSRYFWIMAKTSAGPFSVRIVLSLLVRRARWTPSPESLAVSDSCFSRSVRSVTMTTLKARSTGSERIARTRNTMVSDLPEPWVCQIRPPRRSLSPSSARVLPVRSRCSARPTARYCW